MASILLECGADVNSRDEDDNRSVCFFCFPATLVSAVLVVSLYSSDFKRKGHSRKRLKQSLFFLKKVNGKTLQTLPGCAVMAATSWTSNMSLSRRTNDNVS